MQTVSVFRNPRQTWIKKAERDPGLATRMPQAQDVGISTKSGEANSYIRFSDGPITQFAGIWWNILAFSLRRNE